MSVGVKRWEGEPHGNCSSASSETPGLGDPKRLVDVGVVGEPEREDLGDRDTAKRASTDGLVCSCFGRSRLRHAWLGPSALQSEHGDYGELSSRNTR